MSQYYLFQDQRKCIGCLGCEVHCKAQKGLPAGPRLSKVVQVGPKMIGGLAKISFVFMPCFHCEEAWCVSVCPTKAMRKRETDGIVFVDSASCVGCKSCITACPWGTPQWNAKTGKVVKCDYCMDRIDQGIKPACVTKCVTHCLQFGKANEVRDVRRERFAQIFSSEK